jgi:transposase
MTKRYNDEFKKQIVSLANSGKKVSEIIEEYGVARSTIHKWKKHYNSSGSFKAVDNRTDTEKELIKLRKENQKLKMENDILKQAALILGQK